MPFNNSSNNICEDGTQLSSCDAVTIPNNRSNAVTSVVCKDTLRLINIAKFVSNYFIEQSVNDEHIAHHLKKALVEADKAC